jgi:hypothetical protein
LVSGVLNSLHHDHFPRFCKLAGRELVKIRTTAYLSPVIVRSIPPHFIGTRQLQFMCDQHSHALAQDIEYLERHRYFCRQRVPNGGAGIEWIGIIPIQHRALPDEDWDAIREALPDLKAKIDDLAGATMPKKHAGQADELAEQAKNLEAAWKELSKVCEADDPEAIADDFATMHDHFHARMGLAMTNHLNT